MAVLPQIGLVVTAFSMLKTFFEKTAPIDKWAKTFEDAEERFKEFPKIITQLEVSLEGAATNVERFGLSIAVTAGIMSQLKTQMKDFIALEKSTEKTALINQRIKIRNKQKELKIQNDIVKSVESQTGAKQKTVGAAQMVTGGAEGTTTVGAIAAKNVKLITSEIEILKSTLSDLELEVGILDPSTFEGVQKTLVQGQVALELLMETAKGEELVFAQRNLSAVNKLLERLSTAKTPEAIDAIYQEFVKVSDQAGKVEESFTSAGDILSDVSALFATASSRTGEFNDVLKVMDKAINLIANGKDFKTVLTEYKEMFENFGINTTDIVKAEEEFTALVKRFEDFNSAAKAQGTLDAISTKTILLSSRERVGLEEQMSRQKDRTKHAQERLNLALIIGVDVEKARLEVIKAQTDELKTQKAVFKSYANDMKTSGAGEGVSRFLAAGGDVAAAQLDIDNNEGGAPATDEQKATLSAAKLSQAQEGLRGVAADMAELGPEGAFMSAAIEGATNMQLAFTTAFEIMGDASASMSDKVQAGLGAVSAMISAVAQMSKASSDDKVRAIDQEIAAEKKRDGSSEASLSKISGLEKKKEKEQKKAFETNKKMKMAQTAIATASGALAAYTSALESGIPAPYNAILGATMAAAVVAMGAKQMAMISATSFQGGGSAGGSAPTGISVGGRSNSVDMARGRSPSGELAYARGESGTGQGMTNFRPTGAFAGYKHRAGGGYIVGEQGPEVFMPETPGEIIPSGQGTGGTTNVNFSINAVDAAGIEDLLMNQRGNIIGMIRESANAHGETFLEGINTMSGNEGELY